MSPAQKPDVPEPTTVDDLKAMLGAPDVDELKVSTASFTKPQSARPIWKSPIAKLGLVGVGLVPVFVLASAVLKESKHLSHTKRVASPATEAIAAQPNEAELERLQRENAALKSKSALEGQAYAQGRSTPPPARRASPTPARPTTASTRPSPTPAPPATISYRSTPPAIYSNPASRAEPTGTSVASAPTPVSHPSEVDPVAQWQQLARLGSYGAIALPESLPPERMIATIKSVDTPAAATSPVAHVQPIAAAPKRSSRTDREPFEALDEQPAIAEPHSAIAEPPPVAESADSNPLILEEAEAMILQDQQPATQSLLAGTSSAGELMTPVVLENLEGQNTFVVELNEPLRDSQGEIALPKGSKLLVQIDHLSENGWVELSATQAIWEVKGLKQQAILPAGVIQIRGKAGEPLVARSQGNRGNHRFEREAAQFALGAIRRSAGLYTRAQTRVQTGDRTTVVTEDNPAPNLLAGALEGGTEAVLDALSNRNQRAIDEQERQPRIDYIKAGTPVQVFVNQSMELTM